MTVGEDDILKNIPWIYGELTRRLKWRYTRFKVNTDYQKLRKSIENEIFFVGLAILILIIKNVASRFFIALEFLRSLINTTTKNEENVRTGAMAESSARGRGEY